MLVSLVAGQSLSQSKKAALPEVKPINSTSLREVVNAQKGKVVLVNAWATWCKPCKEEIPDLLRLKAKYAGKGFELVFISADDADELETSVRPTLQKLGVNFLTYINRDSSDEAFINGMSAKWNGALPTSFLYDRKGNLNEMLVGGRKYRQFEEVVVQLLKGPT
jgi:thiol-disulfide isomerase/thioredoxin